MTDDQRDTKILAHFDKLDSNGDGYLSQDEFMTNHHMRKTDGTDQDHMHDLAARALAMMDKNGDGSLSRLEFVNAQWDRFNRTDTNHDDELDRDEIRWSIRKSGQSSLRTDMNYDYDYGSPTDLRGHADFEADLNEEISVWQNPDER